MIGRLRGILSDKQPPWLVLDVQGVGYEVEAPMSTFYKLPDTGQELHLFIHMVVREDAQLLYGFAAERERRMFRELIRISGIGPRMALAILSGMDADEFTRCVQASDTSALVRLPGIGKKTAERLLVEMRDRLKGWSPAPGAVARNGATAPGDPASDAIAALIALGYKPPEASRLVDRAAGPGLSTEAIIRAVLKQG